MITFSINFNYNNEAFEASVFETDSSPKHWTITVKDNRLPLEFQGGHLFVSNDNEDNYLSYGLISNDTNNVFKNSLALALRSYLDENKI